MDLILCTHKNTRLEILDPKKYMTFFIVQELLAWRKFEPQIFQTQKNTRLNLQPKKIQELKILDPKKYVGPRPPVTFIPEYPTWDPDSVKFCSRIHCY